MTSTGTTPSSPPGPSRGLAAPLRAAAETELGLLIVAAAAVLAGLWLNWSWLVAIGVAPLAIGILPCAATCALGLCIVQKGREGATPAPSNDPAQVGLDVERLTKDMLDHAIKKSIALAETQLISGTPTFVSRTGITPELVDLGVLKQMTANARKG